MKCDFCEQEFSDTVFPIHLERCPKRKSVETEQSPEVTTVNVKEEIPASEVEEEENQADKTEANETDPVQAVETEQSPEVTTAGKKKSKK